MPYKKTFIIFITICYGVLLFFSLSQAQVLSPKGLQTLNQGITSTSTNAGLQSGPQNITQLAVNIIKVLLGIVGLVFFVLIIFGGFRWMTAGGNEQKVAEAKKLITNAVIGLAIISAAYAISTFVANALEPDQPDQTQNP